MNIQKMWTDTVKAVNDKFEGEGVDVYVACGQPCVSCDGEKELTRLEDYLRDNFGTNPHNIFYKVDVA